jgi:transposase
VTTRRRYCDGRGSGTSRWAGRAPKDRDGSGPHAGAGKRRRKEVREFTTCTGGLIALRDWLVDEEVALVVMEATGVYWRPAWHVLEE